MKLTQTVQKGGCAAKVAASELRKILAEVHFPPPHPELIVDGRHFDDAAIYKVSDNLALVQTIDFFTPIVDDPYTFGQVAACNALSDVYAMGGRPVTAMAVLAFPVATMDNSVVTRILQGASDLIGQAGANFVGGHSIDDDTLKFGLSVTGLVHPNQVWSNQGCKSGDKLILTKPLGTGTLTAALKRQAVSEPEIHEAIASMTQLNNVWELLSAQQLSNIHAATDITGFGLSGHSWQMAKASQKTFQFDETQLPTFERAQEMIEKEFLTKAHRTNKEYVSGALSNSPDGWKALIIHDPQTSGGLLLSVAPESAESIVQSLRSKFQKASIIGQAIESGGSSQVQFGFRFG